MFRRTVRTIKAITTRTFVLLIRAYQILISPLTGRHCRFYPTCSAYAKQAFEQHGPGRGLYFTLRRLLRCHPFHPGGYDPIPKERLKTHGH